VRNKSCSSAAFFTGSCGQDETVDYARHVTISSNHKILFMTITSFVGVCLR